VTWTRYIFEEHRTHVVPKSLAATVLHDMMTLHGAKLRDYAATSEYRNPSTTSTWSLDFGGMWTADLPTEEVRLRGLTIEVPSHHVEIAIARMRKLQPQRLSSGDVWYGLPHFHHALILLPQQYLSLLAQLVAITPRAAERSDVFENARERVLSNTIPLLTPDGELVRGIVPSPTRPH
jgi:hypothetical protein